MIVVGIIIIILAILFGGLHKIDEGHVGVYHKLGVISNELTGPGYNFRIPILTDFESVQVSVQTDQVTNIPCGTSGGVMLNFDKIEVVNRLKREYVYETIKNYTGDYDKIWIYDKIHSEINQFCSQHTLNEVFIDLFDTLDEELISALQRDLSIWAPGIEIISIRVTKPRIPLILKLKFEEIEKQRSQLLITEEKQKIEIQQAQAQQKQAIIQWQSKLDVTQVNVEREIQEKMSKLNISLIENQIYLNQQKAQADSYYYNNIKELETNQLKLSPQFLFYNAIESLLTNSNFAIGEQIPQYISPQELISKFFNIFILNKEKYQEQK